MATRTPTGGGPTDAELRVQHQQALLQRVERLRRAGEHLAAAEFLECRAERAPTPELAALLRERARERRHRGDSLLAGLDVRPGLRGPDGVRPSPDRRT